MMPQGCLYRGRWAMRILSVVALSLPLAGCFGVSLVAPKPVPDWAMQPQADATEPAARPQRVAAERRAPRVVRQAVEQTASVSDAPTYVQPAQLTRPIVRKKPTALSDGKDVTAYSPEWQAREDALDAELKRSMSNVCRGC
jgi:hypothetical protein